MTHVVPDPDTVLLLSPHTCISRLADGRLEVDTPKATLTYPADNARRASALLKACLKPKTLTQLRSDTHRDLALLTVALEAGAVRDVSAFIHAATSVDQLAAYYVLCDDWACEIFDDPFWTLVLAGNASTSLMLSWCEQFYHRTVGADLHNALAVANCSLPSVERELVEHFQEEIGHGEIFLQGLEEAGVTRQAITSRSPLPETRALIAFFSALAQTDTLAYLSCYGVLHAPRNGQTLDAVRAQFAMLSRAYPDAEPAIRRIGRHAEIDVIAGHDQIAFEPYLLSRRPLRGTEAMRALGAVRGTVTAFKRFFRGILADCENRPRAPRESARRKELPTEADPSRRSTVT